MAMDEALADERPALVVIGNFDGVHRGHQAVMEAVHALAVERDVVARVLTFEPHPAAALGRTPPPKLTSLPRKIELLKRACPGVEVVVRPFTAAFAQLSPEQFAQQVLATQWHARLVMVGCNFRFGYKRAGSVADLSRLGKRYDFETVAEPLVSDDNGAWSSTRIRALVAAGDMVAARHMLGRPHMLEGKVVHGAQRGRALGFPTCNIAAIEQALPPFGVYAVLVDRCGAGGAQVLARGVANFGVRPSLDERSQAPLLEVHLFDTDANLYGAKLRVHLVARLRPE
ncbi:MAG TPA: riboflavin biosynthesis protein RibF, partial [Sorangium sp.]|nr:riboflavin biosynthesis protein RibF [Sorangium sp.]